MTQVRAQERQRLPIPDIARFYGIVLVYYGHIIERIMYMKDPTATLHYKFIYSFHMPFFFLLAGYVASPDKAALPMGRFFKRLAASRLTPYLFFSLVLALMSLVFTGHYVVVPLTDAKAYLQATAATLMGFPIFNIPLWFMACLITVEILHRLWTPLVRTTTGLVLTALACLAGGLWLNQQVFFLLDGMNFWFANEAPVMAAFYLVGVLQRRKGFLTNATSRPALALGALAAIAATVLTFNLNEGPFRMFQAVVIVLGAHGNPALFIFTALTGSLALLLLAALTPPAPWLSTLGRNVLTIFCLNGIFYHYINGPFADWFTTTFTPTPTTVTIAGLLFTTTSLAAAIPLTLLLNRLLPQLTGQPTTRGPILPPLAK